MKLDTIILSHTIVSLLLLVPATLAMLPPPSGGVDCPIVGEQRCYTDESGIFLPQYFEYMECSADNKLETRLLSPGNFCCPSLIDDSKITQVSIVEGSFGFNFVNIDFGLSPLICPTAWNPFPNSIWGPTGTQVCFGDDTYVEFPINIAAAVVDPGSIFRPVAPGTKCCQSVSDSTKIMLQHVGTDCALDFGEEDFYNLIDWWFEDLPKKDI